MCLVTTDATIRIAKTNMIVYKIGAMSPKGKYFYSEMQEYRYTLGELNSCDISKPENDGLYYDVISSEYYEEMPNKQYISRGFHSARKKERFVHSYFFTDVVKCTIPKGSQYIKDKTGLIVSNQIIINKQVKRYPIIE